MSNCTKKQHPTWKAAQQMLARMRREGKDQMGTLNIYRCKRCGYYHLGNKLEVPSEPRGPRYVKRFAGGIEEEVTAWTQGAARVEWTDEE